MVERVVVAVFRQDADIAFAIRDLVLTGGVVSDIGVRDVFDMPNDAVEYFCDLNIGLVINRDDLARGAVLALIVRNLTNVLRQFVNG